MRAAIVLFGVLAAGCGSGGPGGGAGGNGGSGPGTAVPGGTAVVAHPDPLPTAAVDARLFPVNNAARRRVAGRTFFVGPAGDDAAAGTQAAPFRTIRRGIEAALAAGAGNRVVVAGGTYVEGEAGDDHAFRIDRDGTVVEAAPGERALVRPAGGGVGYGLEIRASRVTWLGVSFEGFAANAIAVGLDGATVRDVVIADLTIDMPAGGDGIAVYPDHRASGMPVVDGLLVERVTVRGADQGITVGAGPARSVALRQVVVRNRGGAGGGSGADAIAVESGDNILVNGAEISGGDADGIDLKATRAAVVNAYIHDLSRNAVKLWSGGDIVGCLIHDCGADASIVLDGAGSYRILNTTVAFHNRRAGGAAAYAMTAGYDRPRDAIALEIAGSAFWKNAGPIVLSAGTRAAIRSSLLAPGPGGAVLEYGWDGQASATIDAASGAAALARAGTASGNLAPDADPRFAEPAPASLAGFALGAASPLREAGAAIAPFSAIDLLGAPRVVGTAPDIGPLEAR